MFHSIRHFMAEETIYQLYVFHVRESFRLKELTRTLGISPHIANSQRILYKLSNDSFFLLYNFGAVVFFNVPSDMREFYLQKMQQQQPHVFDNAPTCDRLVEF